MPSDRQACESGAPPMGNKANFNARRRNNRTMRPPLRILLPRPAYALAASFVALWLSAVYTTNRSLMPPSHHHHRDEVDRPPMPATAAAAAELTRGERTKKRSRRSRSSKRKRFLREEQARASSPSPPLPVVPAAPPPASSAAAHTPNKWNASRVVLGADGKKKKKKKKAKKEKETTTKKKGAEGTEETPKPDYDGSGGPNLSDEERTTVLRLNATATATSSAPLGAASVTSLVPTSGGTGTTALILDSEPSYCDPSYLNRTSYHKCLVSSPDGTSATVRIVKREDVVDHLILSGKAFDMFPNNNKNGTAEDNVVDWAGRRFNNLMEIYHALILARACGRVVILPRTLNPASSSRRGGGGRGRIGGEGGTSAASWHDPTSLFDCVDFRHSVPFEGMDDLTDDDKSKFCSVDHLRTKTSREVSLHYRNRRDTFPVQNTEPFDDIRCSAKRFTLAYWGMRPGSYRCTDCPAAGETDHRVVVHVRGGDVFDVGGSVPIAHKGQPPLDFYVKAIRHSAARHVTVVAEDWKNPVLPALREYDWTKDGEEESKSGGEGVVTLRFLVGADDYEYHLRLLFCARTVIFGNTSMGTILAFAPNLESAYVGRLVDIRRSVSPNDDAAGSSVQDPVPCEHCEMIDEPWVQPLLKKMVRAKVYGYVAHRDYGPYQEWLGHNGQLRQMLSYRGGSLVSLNL